MKVTKIILLLFIIIISCTKEDESKLFTNDRASFVRFLLLIDNNNDVLEYPKEDSGAEPVLSYSKDDFRVLKIPVVLTASINKEVTVSFSSEITGNLSLEDIRIIPENKQFIFSKNKLVDTIYVAHKTRVTNANTGKIKFELTTVSNPEIEIGIDNEEKNNTLEISISPQTDLIYTFKKNREEIIGKKGSTINFKIMFPNGFLQSEITGKNLFKISNAFDITTVRNEIKNNTAITYTATLNEDLPENKSFDALVNLEQIDNYSVGAIKCLQITKPFSADRSKELNIAGNFYDDNVPNYRLRGEYWRPDTDILGQCEWFNTNVFSVPVIVNKDHPNAIQVKGESTTEISDDVYYHRYRIGMVSPIAGRTTTPFALKSLLIGESSDNSAGLNMVEALEFFPDNGTNKTFGTVSVVAQKLSIVRRSDGKGFSVPILGTGTYKVLNEATNLWRIDIDVTFDFTEINGTVKTLPYVYFNQVQTEPDDPIDINACFEPIEL